MTIIDPTTNLGKLRLRVADYSDLPFLPDSVYTATLADTNDNLPRAAKIVASYILGIMSQKTHRRLSSLEVWGAEAFKNYKEFLLLTFTNPHFMDIAPVPYFGGVNEKHQLVEFVESWNKNFYNGNEKQQSAFSASVSPNDGSLYGPTGSLSGWTLV